MTVVVDGIIFGLQRHGGISVYFRELLDDLARLDGQAMLTLETPLQQDVDSSAGGVEIVRRPARRLERYRRARLPARASLFHSSYYRLPATRTVPTVVTVHDFIYERYRSGPSRWMHTAQKHAAIRAAQAIICISESTRDDLLEMVGVHADQQVHVIHNGVSELFRPMGLSSDGPPFALFIGERRGYKNFALALQALGRLPGIELHCVGGGPLRDEEFAGISPSVRRRVRHLGYVSDESLNSHYNRALCLLYPSRYEGFGIPVLEAMRAGCPVVCIECKAVLEIGGDALIVAREEPQALADGVVRAADSAGRSASVARGLAVAGKFSWRAAHRRTLQIYQALGALQGNAQSGPLP